MAKRPPKTKRPRTLIYDLETSHNIGAFFKLWEDRIPYGNIMQERFIICGAWRWLGEKAVHTVSVLDDSKRFKKDPCDDAHVVETLHKVMSEADVVVAHNGDRFDNRYLATRILFHGLPPLPPIPTVDTYKIAKRKFMFNSNSLDYIGSYLGLGHKKRTSPGLWLGALQGNKKAIQEMVSYNKRDVTLLEDVFLKMRPYMPSHLNRELFGHVGCPRCGSTKVQSRGTHKAISRTYQRFQCQADGCRGWFRKLKAEPNEATEHKVL